MGNIISKVSSKNILSIKRHSGPLKSKSISSPFTDLARDGPDSRVVPQPPLDELNAMFETLLDDLNLMPDKKEMMRRFPPERKWLICQANMKEKNSLASDTDYLDVIKSLKSPSLELLSSLSVSLRARPIRWISKFIENEGLASLLDYLQNMDPSKLDHEELVIKCLKALMNNKHGLSSVINHQQSISVIALSLSSPSFRTRTLVLEILGAVCLIPGCHKRVLDAMDFYAIEVGEKQKYDMVANCLSVGLSAKGIPLRFADEKLERAIELQIAALSFINALICGGAGHELEYRLHKRLEFDNLGVGKIVERLKDFKHEILQTQINVYLNRAEADESELAQRLNITSKVKYDDAKAVFGALLTSVHNTRCYTPFLTILNHLLIIPLDSKIRWKYWIVVEIVVKQLIKHEKTIDPINGFPVLDTHKIMASLNEVTVGDGDDVALKKARDDLAKAQLDVAYIKETHAKEIKILEGKIFELIEREKQCSDELLKAKLQSTKHIDDETKLQKPIVTNDNEISFKPIELVPPAPPPPPPPAPPAPPPPSFVSANVTFNSPVGASLTTAPPPPPPPAPPSNNLKSYNIVQAGIRPKRNIIANTQLRPFQWTKINNVEIKETVWCNLNDESVYQKIDTVEFERLFAAFQRKEKEFDSKRDLAKGLSEESVNGEQAPKIMILAPKRAQMCNILLKSLKISVGELRRAILAVDMDILKPHIVSELLKLVPSTDEISMLQQFENEEQNMAVPEFFFWQVSKIHRYQERVRVLYVRGMFDEWLEDARRQVKSWESGCKNLLQSKSFHEILQVILALGNYLNSGSRGGAYGFKIESLLKLADVRSTVENRRFTLLHYLAEIVEEKMTHLAMWQNDLKDLEMAAKVEIPVLKQTLSALRSGLNDVKLLLKNISKESKDPADNFPLMFTDWLKVSNERFDTVETSSKEVEKLFEKVCKLYAEDSKSTTPAELFGRLHNFSAAYSQSKLENDAAKLKQEENEKKERDRRSKKRNEESTTAVPESKIKEAINASGPVVSTQNEGEFDDLISAIKTGKAFFNQGFEPQKRQRASGGMIIKSSMMEISELVAAGEQRQDGP